MKSLQIEKANRCHRCNQYE